MPAEFSEIDRQAARWVNQMNLPVQSSETAAAFDRWIMKDPRNAENFALIQAIWQSGGFEEALEEAETAPILHQAPNDNAPLPWFSRNWRKLGGAFAISGLLIALPLLNTTMIERAHFQAPHGENRSVTLADGSSIVLSSSSAIDVKITPWSREVALLEGEAFFDVAHEKLRSFTVDMGKTQVSVLGTAFDINLVNPDTVTIRVFRGLVGVDAGAGRLWRLPAGGGMEISGDRLRSLPKPFGDQPGWIEGWYDASDTPVRQLIEQLNRVSPKPIMLKDPALGDLLVSGRFHTSKPEGVLDALAVTYNLNWRRQGDHYLISR